MDYWNVKTEKPHIMRKIVYTCMFLMTLLEMCGQVNNDRSWTLFFSEEFNGFNRGWGRDYVEVNSDNANLKPRWHCFYEDYWPSCITLSYDQHHVFQRSQCLFNDGINYSDGILRIVAKRIDPNSDVSVDYCDYEFPEPSSHWPDTSHHWLYYYSGCVETIQKFLYGYFEIRCKNPVHQGAFPAFWLWGNGLRKYEEIDIYEYMWDLTNPEYDTSSPYLGYPYVFTTGVWYNGQSPAGDPQSFARKKIFIPESETDISQWHTFGCEWSPGLVVWYYDGKPVNEFRDEAHVPCSPMRIIANYSIDRYSLSVPDHYYSKPEWKGTDTLLIDYIKVYKLDGSDCDEDAVITNSLQLANHDHKVKHSISICSGSGTEIITMANSNITMRAVESIAIEGPFSTQQGTELTMVVHGCPDD